MIAKKYILKTLENLEDLYNSALNSPNPQDATLFSKLALLEYCGWIEESMDDIAKRAVKYKIRTLHFQQIFKDRVEGIHGFLYKKHFRTMLIQTMGIVEMEKLQTFLSSTNQLGILDSQLETLKAHRDKAAHTWIGVMNTYPAPSLSIYSLSKLYPILRNIYSFIIRL